MSLFDVIRYPDYHSLPPWPHPIRVAWVKFYQTLPMKEKVAEQKTNALLKKFLKGWKE